MSHLALTAESAHRAQLTNQALRYGSQSIEDVAEPFLSRNFQRQRAILSSLGSAISQETVEAVVQAMRAGHLRLSHHNSLDPTPTFSWRNRFTGRSLQTGTDQVVATDTHARLTAAMWADDKKMVKKLGDDSDLREQAQISSFADINVMPVDPAFQKSGRLDKIRAQAQSEATSLQPLYKGTEDYPLQAFDPQFDSLPANLTVWENDVRGWRALEGSAGLEDADAEVRAAARRAAQRDPADPMALPGAPGGAAAGGAGAAGEAVV
jgi:hypothetical protein